MVDLSIDLDKTSSTYQDLLIENGDLVLTSDANPDGTNPIQQDIRQKIGTFLGEWFNDNTIGVDYYGQIFVKNPDQSKVDAIIQNIIRTAPGVTLLTSYAASVNSVTRVLTLSFVAQTTQGQVDYSGTVSPISGTTTIVPAQPSPPAGA
jgi:hypothetical protein